MVRIGQSCTGFDVEPLWAVIWAYCKHGDCRVKVIWVKKSTPNAPRWILCTVVSNRENCGIEQDNKCHVETKKLYHLAISLRDDENVIWKIEWRRSLKGGSVQRPRWTGLSRWRRSWWSSQFSGRYTIPPSPLVMTCWSRPQEQERSQVQATDKCERRVGSLLIARSQMRWLGHLVRIRKGTLFGL